MDNGAILVYNRFREWIMALDLCTTDSEKILRRQARVQQVKKKE